MEWWAIGFPIVVILIGFIWRDMVNRVNALSIHVSQSTEAVLIEKVKNLEIDYATLHQWKNVILPQNFERQSENIINVMRRIESDLDRRMDRLERYSNGRVDPK